MTGVRVTGTSGADLQPRGVQFLVLGRAAREGEPDAFIRVHFVAEGLARILGPVRQGLELGAVLQPVVFDVRVCLEILALLGDGLLLAVGAIERINIGEELFRVGLLDFPRWIAGQRVEAARSGGAGNKIGGRGAGIGFSPSDVPAIDEGGRASWRYVPKVAALAGFASPSVAPPVAPRERASPTRAMIPLPR